MMVCLPTHICITQPQRVKCHEVINVSIQIVYMFQNSSYQWHETGVTSLPSLWHYMSIVASHLPSKLIVCSTAWSAWQQRKLQCYALLAGPFMREIHQWLIEPTHPKGPVMRKVFPYHNDIMPRVKPAFNPYVIRVIIGISSANERQHYNVKLSLIGYAQAQNDTCAINDTSTNWNRTFSWVHEPKLHPKANKLKEDTSIRVDSRFAPSQWEMSLLCNDVSHWLGANLESALSMVKSWPVYHHWNRNVIIFTKSFYIVILTNFV